MTKTIITHRIAPAMETEQLERRHAEICDALIEDNDTMVTSEIPESHGQWIANRENELAVIEDELRRRKRVELSQRRLTHEQIDRIRNLAAYAPLTRRDIDDELDALGWTERYDGDETATILRPERYRAFFGPDGSVLAKWMPRK